jgi:large subunit ribosomal protein L15
MELLKKLKLINKNSQKLKILGTGEIKDKGQHRSRLSI